MNKLPEPFKTSWIAALRSGNFKQGRLLLYDKVDDTFCCLGVACEISGVKIEDMNEFFIIPREPFLSVPELIIGVGTVPITLSNMNDEGVSFGDIADYIDKNL